MSNETTILPVIGGVGSQSAFKPITIQPSLIDGHTNIVQYSTLAALQDAEPLPQGQYMVSGSSIVWVSNGVTLEAKKNSIERPWILASFGDSRSSASTSSTPDVSLGQAIADARVPGYLPGLLGDAEYMYNYGISGDTASNWNSTARTGGKTLASLLASNADAVTVQYGINDAMALTSATTIVGYLQPLCLEIIKAGKYLIFESIQPLLPGAANAAVAQATADSVNATMKAFIALFPAQARFADTATLLKDATGFASSLYTNTSDKVHTNPQGAILAATEVARVTRELLPKRRTDLLLNMLPGTPNLLNWASPSVYTVISAGTVSTPVITNGVDAGGSYTDVAFTPTSLTSGLCGIYIQLAANFQTASQPAYALQGNEILQGSARVLVDDGNGNAPNAFNICLRQRFFTASLFKDWGTLPQAAQTADLPNYYSKFDMRLTTPRMANTASSVVANPAASTGYQLQVYVGMAQINIPVRVRIYNAQLAIVGYKNLIAVTPGASPYTYTNTTTGKQFVYVAGGTVSGITHNGTATGQIAGVFLLDAGDSLVTTYTVAPTTFTVKQFP